MGVVHSGGASVVIVSEVQFRWASVLVVAGVLALLVAGVLLRFVPIDAGNTVCGNALRGHPGLVLRYIDGPPSPWEEQQHAACTAAGAPAWYGGLAAAGVGSVLLVAGGVLVLATRDRA